MGRLHVESVQVPDRVHGQAIDGEDDIARFDAGPGYEFRIGDLETLGAESTLGHRRRDLEADSILDRQ